MSEGNSTVLASQLLSKLPKYIQFFYSKAKTTRAQKHILFVINYKVLTRHGEGKQRSKVEQ